MQPWITVTGSGKFPCCFQFLRAKLFQNVLRPSGLEQRQPVHLHTERQYAHCYVDMGHAPPWGCSNPGPEGTNPSRCMGPNLHTPPPMHWKLSSLHVDSLGCVLCMQPSPGILHIWPQMEYRWKLSPSQRQRRVLLCHSPSSAWVQRLQLWWLKIPRVFLCKSCMQPCVSLGVFFFCDYY